jgi:hypothetical protein
MGRNLGRACCAVEYLCVTCRWTRVSRHRHYVFFYLDQGRTLSASCLQRAAAPWQNGMLSNRGRQVVNELQCRTSRLFTWTLPASDSSIYNSSQSLLGVVSQCMLERRDAGRLKYGAVNIS